MNCSVRLSVTRFWLYFHHCITVKFSGVITSDRSDIHAKGQGQRSKVKFTEVKTQCSRFRTVTPIWNHIWWWHDAQSLMLLRRGAILFFLVIHRISRSNGTHKIAYFDPNWAFPVYYSSWDWPMDLEWCTKIDLVLEKSSLLLFEVILKKCQSHTGWKSTIWINFE